MKILVTGGREYSDKDLMWTILDRYRHGRGQMLVVAHGAARGADALAAEWCRVFKSQSIHEAAYPVSKALDGPWPQAGINRNLRMFDDFDPDLVLAFKHGFDRTLARGGTEHMVRTAMSAGVPVRFFGSFNG